MCTVHMDGAVTCSLPFAARQETQDEEELNIAPKKANWDLKRDVEKKLDKLNRRTQRAIVEIIRERMAEVCHALRCSAGGHVFSGCFVLATVC